MIYIRIDGVIYDTVFCTAFISYDTEKKIIEEADLVSNLSYTEQSSLKWTDWIQYGACDHDCAEEELPALAECVKDKDWTWNKGKIVPQAIKDEVLAAMLGG